MKKSVLIKLTISVALCLLVFILFKKATNNAMFMNYYYFFFTSIPEELREPIIYDNNFNFNRKGETKTYKFGRKNCNNVGFYDVLIYDKNERIPPVYKVQSYKGKIRLDFYCKEKILHSELIDGARCWVYSKDMHHHESLFLYCFSLPLHGKKDDISIKVTVIEPFTKLSKLCKELQLRVKFGLSY